jgi:transcriptional regulator of acetoin/glycerol metabolism
MNHQFRADLYYRLNVARLDLPPLKDRREDIPLLIGQAVAELNRYHHCAVGTPDRELMQCLLAHDWPGNIRELRNLLETVFIDPPAGAIGLNDLPPVFRNMFVRYRTSTLSEREQLLDVLEQTNWNKSEAARQLKWSRRTLYRKLVQYRVE